MKKKYIKLSIGLQVKDKEKGKIFFKIIRQWKGNTIFKN